MAKHCNTVVDISQLASLLNPLLHVERAQAGVQYYNNK